MLNDFVLENELVQIDVLIEGEGKEKLITFPISFNKFNEIEQELYQNETGKYSIKKIESNCGIKMLNDEKEIIGFGSREFRHLKEKEQIKEVGSMEFFTTIAGFQDIAQILNHFSNAREIKALTEYGITSIDELMKVISKGEYHFYPNISLEDESGDTTVEFELITLCNDEKIDKELENCSDNQLTNRGYFPATTGLLLIKDKELYKKAKANFDKREWQDKYSNTMFKDI